MNIKEINISHDNDFNFESKMSDDLDLPPGLDTTFS
ncbi:Uncharacterised protein [Klebsiella pneumoniae]|nr:Uncharacterised protein [Klebsiella pneumoniae]VGD36053.1 Uncharacterised protein [Klebsiella pneumoniae]